MIRVHVHGAAGRMGTASVAAVRSATDLELVGTSGRGDDLAASLAGSQPEVVVEFTVPDAVEASVATILEAGAHVVSGTTGLPADAAARLGETAASKGLGFLLAPNFALGVILMQRFAREAAKHFDDVEILELHHDKKVDAPSGTALHTAEMVAAAAGRPLNDDRVPSTETVRGVRGGAVGGIPIHSVRLPGLLAHQEVMFGAAGQVLTIRHDALDRAAFMPGVLLAVREIRSRRGLVPSLEELL